MAKRKRGFVDKVVDEDLKNDDTIDTEDTSGDESDSESGSLKNNNESPRATGRAAFEQTFVGEGEIEDELSDILGDDVDNDDHNDDLDEDDVDTDDTGDGASSEDTSDEDDTGDTSDQGGSSEDTDSDDDSDEATSEDDAIDLSDLNIESAEDEGEPESDFDPTESLSDKEWKNLPKTTKKFISNHRRHSRHLTKKLDAETPYADYTRQLLDGAAKAGLSNQELDNWAETGFRANQGDPAAIEYLGNIAAKGGYKQKSAPLNLDPIRDHIKKQMDSFDLEPEVGKAIWAEIQKLSTEPEGDLPPASQQATQQPVQQQTPAENPNVQLERAAVSTMEKIEGRYSQKYGAKWSKDLKGRVRDKMILEQAKTQVSPQFWPERYAKICKEVISDYRKKSKVQRKRNDSRMNGDSDSIGRGAPVGSQLADSSKLTGRAAFNKEHVEG